MQLAEISKELTQYNATDAAIADRRVRYMALSIKGIDDKEGFEAVHIARIDVKTIRVNVEKKAKSLKEDALRFQRDVNGEKTRILDLLAPIEDYLSDEENRILEEKAQIKAEEEARRAAEIKVRVDKLYSLDCRFDGTIWLRNGQIVATQAEIITAPDEYFQSLCKTLQTAVDDENTAKAVEAMRIAKEKAELARIAAEQAKERERLAAEGMAIQNEKDRLAREKKAAEDATLKVEQDKLRAIEMETAKAEAAEKARLAEIERVRLEAEEKIRKEEKARIAAERKAQRRPDKEKLLEYARAITDIPQPSLKHDEFIALLATTTGEISQVLADLNKRLEEM